MLVIWSVVYYTSLVSIELNLNSGCGLTIGDLGKKFSGKIAYFIGKSSYKILSYALLAVYLYGSSSIIKSLLESYIQQEYSFNTIATIYALIMWVVFILPTRTVDYINRLLFIGLIVIISILVISIISKIDWTNLPLFVAGYKDISNWKIIIPIIFTSFGFQIIFHTLADYCNKDPVILKRSFFWGSLIPVIVYIIWTSSIIGVIHEHDLNFYTKMVEREVEVGDLIKSLSNISQNNLVQNLIWWISILAISTSIIGTGISLCDSLKKSMLYTNIVPSFYNIITPIIAISPAYLITILVPNAFLSVLGFAGMILVIIAIILPIYLLSKIKNSAFYYSELNCKLLLNLSKIIGIIIMICEILNIFN